ncbi:phage tail protein [Hafnia alvei]|uniref:Phage tail tube protein, TTP n=3 Tax=Hafniaceae TaxID=1903412 RepID=A0A1C6YVU1_HAFAL|nr:MULTISPECIES: phage tail protein [Hafniaceae]EJS8701413.1 phage tail protein [Escherichia coli]AMO82113.1 phage tail protein [Obesumbacterium proteus]AMO83121.1 phage tail protein [Obesumbacterium proteus]MEB7890973.1 phage tail protein [Hafnia alvei]NLS56217.1 phage tail protein [Hafnia alvei]
MGFALPNGSHVYLAKTYAEAETVTAATNAAETVFTTAEATKAKAGDIIHIRSAWPGLDEVIARVKEASESSVTLEDINTLNTGDFAAGGGAGSFRVIKSWEEMSQITEVASSGGEQQSIQLQFLSDTTQRNVNTFKTARVQTYTIAHDSSLPFYDLLRQADSSQDTLAAYMFVPKAKENRYWSAKASFNDIPNTAVNTVETVTATLNLQSGLTAYKQASATAPASAAAPKK